MNIKQPIHLSKADADQSLFDDSFLSVFDNSRKDYANIIELENKLEFFLENDSFVSCLSSGTSSIHLALLLAGVKKGDEVLCQTFTFVATVNPILYLGATPIFVDSEKETWNMCPESLEKAIQDRIKKGKKPKGIMVVDTYGMPAKMDILLAVAEKYQITLIEDAASALGSSYKNKKCGTFGDFAIFSFNNNKIITTFGGGALVCKDEKEKQQAIFLGTQAKEKAAHYEHSTIGYNYRMSPVLAGIGCKQMEVLDKHISLRRQNNQFYQDFFKGVDGITVFKEPNSDYFSNHWLSCILIDEAKTGFSREDVRLQLLEDNIESRPLWKPMHLQPVFAQYDFYGTNVSEELFEKGLCLPSSSNLTLVEKDRIADSLNKLLKK